MTNYRETHTPINRRFHISQILDEVKKTSFELDEKAYTNSFQKIREYQTLRSRLFGELQRNNTETDMGVALSFGENIFPLIDEMFLGLLNSPSNIWQESNSEAASSLSTALGKFKQNLPPDNNLSLKTQINYLARISRSKSEEETKTLLRKYKKNERKILSREKNGPFIYITYDEQFINGKEIVIPMAYLLMPVGDGWLQKHNMTNVDQNTHFYYCLARSGDAASWFESGFAIDKAAVVMVNDLEENNETTITFTKRLFEESGMNYKDEDILGRLSRFIGWHELGHSRRYVLKNYPEYEKKDFWAEFLADSYLAEKVVLEILSIKDTDLKKKMLLHFIGYLAIAVPDEMTLESFMSNNDSDESRKRYNASKIRILKLLNEAGIINLDKSEKITIQLHDENLNGFIKRLTKYSARPLEKDPPYSDISKRLIEKMRISMY
jgi:hypothetical protein